MNWKEFYQVDIFKISSKGESLLYHTDLKTPDEIPVHELFMPKFNKLALSAAEKKKMCINTRKILHCTHLLETKKLKRWAQEFIQKIESQKEHEVVIKTTGAGIYLVLAALELYPNISKKIICHTTEIPLKIGHHKFKSHSNCQLIYGANERSALVEFPSLWQSSPYLSLFEDFDLKKSA